MTIWWALWFLTHAHSQSICKGFKPNSSQASENVFLLKCRLLFLRSKNACRSGSRTGIEASPEKGTEDSTKRQSDGKPGSDKTWKISISLFLLKNSNDESAEVFLKECFPSFWWYYPDIYFEKKLSIQELSVYLQNMRRFSAFEQDKNPSRYFIWRAFFNDIVLGNSKIANFLSTQAQ